MAFDPDREVLNAKWTPEKQAARKERRRLRKLGLMPMKNLPPAVHPSSPHSERIREASGRKVKIEFTRPEAAAVALDFVGSPPGFDPVSFEAFCKQAGLPKPVTDGVLKRLKTRFAPVVGEIQRHTTKHFQDMIDDRIGRALGYLDDFALSAASAKDLAVTIGILIEKRALLRGEPTQILTVEERQNLNVLVSAVVQEATRRGITIDQTGDEVRAIGGKTRRLLDVPEEVLAR